MIMIKEKNTKYSNTKTPVFGLRAKLSLFVGVMLLVLIGMVLAIVLNQQEASLTQAAESRMEGYLGPVEALTLQADHLAYNLVRLEELRMRIARKEILQKKDPFLPSYYDKKYLENLENKFKQVLWFNKEPDERAFERLQKRARQVALAGLEHAASRKAWYDLNKLLFDTLDYKKRLELSFESLTGQDFRGQSFNVQRQIRFDTKDFIKEPASALRKLNWGQKGSALRSMVDEVISYWKENPSRLISTYKKPYKFENKEYQLIMRTVFRNPWVSNRAILIHKALHSSTSRAWKAFLKKDEELVSSFKELQGQILSNRSEIDFLQKKARDLREQRKYKELQESQKELRKARKLRVALYQEYRRLLAKREALMLNFRAIQYKKSDPDRAARYEKLIDLRRELADTDVSEAAKRQEIEKEIAEIEKQEKKYTSLTMDDRIIEAFAYLRDAWLEEGLALYIDSSVPERRIDGLSAREMRRQEWRWRRLRNWILTPWLNLYTRPLYRAGAHVAGAWRPVSIHLLADRRSAADRMFAIDSTPLSKLVPLVLQKNTSGFTRILMDLSDSEAKIRRERHAFLDAAVSVGLRMVFLAFLFSGAFVAAIQRIIAGAKQVGEGNLKTHFVYEGRDELRQLTDSLNEMVHGLREREELRGELSAAEEIQKQLLPTEKPKNMEGFISLGMFYKAMHGVGGDYYDVIAAGPDEIALCIADVSNHGVGPAIVMTLMRSHLHTLIRRGERDPKKILLELNERSYSETPEHIFITMFLGFYNKKTNEMRYVMAGHNPAIIYKYNTEEVLELEQGGLPVSAVPNELLADMIETKTVKLAKGDLFFQYTDGVNEAMNAKDEEYGTKRLLRAIRALGKKKPESIMQAIAQDVEKFSGKKILCEGPSELNDDIAMIAFRRIR